MHIFGTKNVSMTKILRFFFLCFSEVRIKYFADSPDKIHFIRYKKMTEMKWLKMVFEEENAISDSVDFTISISLSIFWVGTF